MADRFDEMAREFRDKMLRAFVGGDPLGETVAQQMIAARLREEVRQAKDESAAALSEMQGQLSTVLAREAATIERHDKKVAEMQEEIERLRDLEERLGGAAIGLQDERDRIRAEVERLTSALEEISESNDGNREG